MAAIAFYKTRGAISHFDDKDYTAFIHRLIPMYNLFSAQLFSKRLLDEMYNNVQK